MPVVAIEEFESEAFKTIFTKLQRLPLQEAKHESRFLVKKLKKSEFADFLAEAVGLGEVIGEGKRSRRRLRSFVASLSSGSFSRLTIEDAENEQLKVSRVTFGLTFIISQG
jgi:hypothetical protein